MPKALHSYSCRLTQSLSKDRGDQTVPPAPGPNFASPLFNFSVPWVVPATKAIARDVNPNRLFNNPALYFFYLQAKPACFWIGRLKLTVKGKNTMQFICIYCPDDNAPPLSDGLPGWGKEVRRWGLRRGWSSVGWRRAESPADGGNTSEILWNHRKGKRRE